MRFAFTEEQLAFRDAVRDLLTKECTGAVVRDAWTNDTGRTKDVWSRLADMGVLGILAPEADGGLGLTDVDLVLLLEETGRAALPEPIVEHAAVGVPLVVDAAPAVAGEVTITAVFSERMVVPVGESADLFLLHHDRALHFASREQVTLSPCPSADLSRRLTAVEWDPARSTRLGPDHVPLAFDRGALGTAAQLCGLADRMIEMTVEYARDRVQFGKPIGSFQAVKHHLADARIALEFAAPARVPGRVVDRARRRRSFCPRVDGQGQGVGRGAARRPGRAPVPRRDRLLLRARPAPVHEAGLGARRGLGRCPLAPGAGPARDPVGVIPGSWRQLDGSTRGVPRRRRPHARRQARRRVSAVHPADLGAHVIKAIVERNDFDPLAVEDVVFGCVDALGPQAGDIARTCWLAAGLPEDVPGTTVDRQCGSSQQAVHFAAQARHERHAGRRASPAACRT